MDFDKLIDLGIEFEDFSKKSNYRVVKNTTSANTHSSYYTIVKLDENGDEIENENGDLIEYNVRVSNHSNMSGRSVPDFNIFDDASLDAFKEKISDDK